MLRGLRAGALGFALWIVSVAGARADSPPETPTGSFFSSLKQAINKDYEHEVVRGHFDLGTPPDSHRFYCLIDAKTGKSEANGVTGQPFVRPDGMTGIKAGAVSFHSCATAEQQGILVLTGYLLSAPLQGASPLADAPPSRNTVPMGGLYDTADVAGLRLGMSPDQVREVLKSKKLLNYLESAGALHDDPAIAAQLPAGGRFVNVIAAWTSASSREAYEVTFTPVPGQERAMSLAHSMSFEAEDAVMETSLDGGLLSKYGGYSGPSLPVSPTWRIQRDGEVLVGDSCDRRAVAGGLRELGPGAAARPNLALKTTAEEFQYQIDHCGIAIISEDHTTANGGAPRQDRMVTRFIVAAYSPSIGLDGAMAAVQLTQTARLAVDKPKASHKRNRPAPNL